MTPLSRARVLHPQIDATDLKKVRDVAEWFLANSDVTNADRPTLDQHSEALTLKLLDVIAEHMTEAEEAAPHERACRCNRCCGSPAYYAQSERL